MGLFDWFSGKPSQDKFAQLMLETVQRLGIAQKYEYDKANFRLVDTTSSQSSSMFLNNAYADYGKASKENRNAVMLKYAQSARQIEVPDDITLASKNLMPAIRNRADTTIAELMLKIEGETVESDDMTFVLAGDLVIAIGYDTEHSMLRIRNDRVTNWNVSANTVLSSSIENLRDRSTDKFEPLGPGCWISAWGDYYDPSRLLLQDMIRRRPVNGDPVVLAPTPQHLLVTGANDDNGLLTLAKVGTEMLGKETKRLSGTALQLQGDKWLEFDPDGSRSLELADLRRRHLAEDYTQQKSLLEKLHEKTGEDVFVGTYMLYQRKESQRLMANSVWTKGVLTYLPVADNLVFVIPEPNELITVPWKAAMTVVGNLMTPLSLFPQRFKVTTFPDAKQLDELRAAANK